MDYKDSWVPKNWCFWTMVLEKTHESPLDCKEIQLVHPKGDQSWVFIGRTDAEAATPILWPPHVKSWLIGKDPDAGKDWGREEKGTTEDEMVGWHHRLNGHEFGWTPGVGDGQGGLVCCDSWGHKESTQLREWTELNCFSGDQPHPAASQGFISHFIVMQKTLITLGIPGVLGAVCQEPGTKTQSSLYFPLYYYRRSWRYRTPEVELTTQ